jgi:hypothetical protein
MLRKNVAFSILRSCADICVASCDCIGLAVFLAGSDLYMVVVTRSATNADGEIRYLKRYFFKDTERLGVRDERFEIVCRSPLWLMR